MSNIRDFESAVIVSITDSTNPDVFLSSAILSITEIPTVRDYFSVMIVSITPPNRYIYGAQKVETRSPFNLMVDMFANSRS